MRPLIIRILINTIALYVTAYLITDVFMQDVWTALLAGLILTLFNTLIRPLLILITLPINILTLGLFTLVINAGMLWLTEVLVPGLIIPGFWLVFLAAIFISLLNLPLNYLFKTFKH